ncbi:MAG: DNA polymerase III subunit delta', partial [Vicinamibacterales bacterium]
VEQRTLPPTLLFTGPEGVGKRLTAVALAQALNCDRQASESTGRPAEFPGSACGECRTCTRIARGVHADVVLVEPGESGSIKVDQVRDAIERSAYRPFEGRRRVVIVDPADALIPEAQNALLKTLEEPPSASVFILITSTPDVLLPTVLSRCHRLRFAPLEAAEVAGVLMRDHGYSEKDAHAAAAAAGGSLGRALAEDAEDAAEARDTAARVLQIAAASSDPRRRIEAAKLLAAGGGDRDEVSRHVAALASIVRDVAAIASKADDHVLANPDLRPELDALHHTFGPDRALSAFAAVDRALDALARNASPKIVADWLAMNL